MIPAFTKCVRMSVLGLVIGGLWVSVSHAQDNSYDIGVLEDRMRNVEGDVERLRRALSGAQAANTAVRLDQLETELRRLTGKVEEMRFALDGMERDMKRFRRNTDDRLTALEGGQPADRSGEDLSSSSIAVDRDQTETYGSTAISRDKAAQTGTLGTVRQTSLPPSPGEAAPAGSNDFARAPASAPEPSVPAPSGSEARAAFNAATGLMRKRKYVEAGEAFERIIRRYPKDPLAAKAQYWLGQSYYFRGQYEEAANAYLDGYRNHPNGSTAPDSLLKLGMTLERLGQPDEACLTFQEVESTYPGASATVKRRTTSEKAKIGCR